MAAQRQYASAGAFRTALEARLNERARRDGVDLQRLRRQVAFDRLLARMFDASQPVSDGWVLKGGYALEMRFHMARSTKDLDLTVRSGQGRVRGPTSLRERLQVAASIELPDFFTFIVGETMAELSQAPEGGARFPVDARLDGRTFAKFHVDLGVGDEVLEPLESIEGEDWLGFAGFPAVVVPALSVEQHWAEKFHAYTRPRETPNSRVRDLVDLVLILEHEAPATERVSAAVDATFQRRGTHPVPEIVPEPPSGWAKPFTALAAECGLEQTLATAHERVQAFWRRVRGDR
jgi:nucleotidyltransferase AbiEii toxin of type IV toxin-antitoxin system